MTKFLLTFIGGTNPETPTEIQEADAAWGAWYGRLGAAVVDPGNPVGASRTIATDGSVAEGGQVSGYALLQADSMDAATVMAKDCPIFSNGGSVIVSEAIEM